MSPRHRLAILGFLSVWKRYTFLNQLSTKTKSVWFFVLCLVKSMYADLFCWNQMFVTNKLCLLRKFTCLSPFPFRVSSPYGPMTFFSLLLPTFPLKSPIKTKHSLPFYSPLRLDLVFRKI